MNVLVYDGDGVSIASLTQTLACLRRHLGHRYAVQRVSAVVLRRDPWEHTCALLVIPGGRDLPYVRELGENYTRTESPSPSTRNRPSAVSRIKNYVEVLNGKYLGLCAGAYFGSGRVEFEPGDPIMRVVGDRHLGFFPGTATGSVFPGFDYRSDRGAVCVSVKIAQGQDYWPSGSVREVPDHAALYVNGACSFTSACDYRAAGITVLASYPNSSLENSAAIVLRRFRSSDGLALLSGPHPEYDPFTIGLLGSNGSSSEVVNALRRGDRQRSALMVALLRTLGLEAIESPRVGMPAVFKSELESESKLFERNSSVSVTPKREWILYTETPDLLLCVQRRLKECIIPQVSELDQIIDDSADRFCFVDKSSSPILRQVKRSQSVSEVSDKPNWDIRMHSSALKFIPRSDRAGSFDFKKYLWHLNDVRKSLSSKMPNHAWVFGSLVIHAETLTSTQSILEKNVRFTELLPSGSILLANHQEEGKGRGGNAWVSPPNCLMFSMVLRHPHGPGIPSVVLIQFLIALAVVKATRSKTGYNTLPLKLKWPNDIYADQRDSGGKLMKIGGVLVNSSYQHNDFVLSIGCGVNIDEPSPTTSINRLVRETLSSQDVIDKEEMLASTLAWFEWLYFETMSGRFSSIVLPCYYENWLHHDQLITVLDAEEVGTCVPARVLGITEDYGMLRAIRVNLNGLSVGEELQLQPDGNSFDMLHGLVRRKL